MPSVLSRLSDLLTPQWVAAFVGGLVALRLLRAWAAARTATGTLARLRESKQARLAAETNLATERLQETEQERREKQAQIVTSAATALVAKMSSGQRTSLSLSAVPQPDTHELLIPPLCSPLLLSPLFQATCLLVWCSIRCLLVCSRHRRATMCCLRPTSHRRSTTPMQPMRSTFNERMGEAK